jgi:hypothetical protein
VRQRRRRAGGREGREKREPDEVHAISKERRGMGAWKVFLAGSETARPISLMPMTLR